MFYKDNSNGNWVIDTEEGQKLELWSKEELDEEGRKRCRLELEILESVIDVYDPLWFGGALVGTNPLTTLRSLEFSGESVNVGFNVDYQLKHRMQTGVALTSKGMEIAERQSKRVSHKNMAFLAPREMKTTYFLMGVAVVDKMTRRDLERYQVIFNPASYMIYVVMGTPCGTGAYGEPMMDEVFILRAPTERRRMSYRNYTPSEVAAM